MTIKEAKVEALSLSLQRPGVTVYVMKKKGKGATVSMNAWVIRERILEGWGSVCRYVDGIEKP